MNIAMNHVSALVRLAAIAIPMALLVAGEAVAKDSADAKAIATEKKVAAKLAELGATVSFCENGQVDKVEFLEEDPHSLAPQISTKDLKTIRPYLDKLTAVREVSLVMEVNDPAEIRELAGIPKLTTLSLQGGDKMRIEAKHLAGLGDSGSLKHLSIIGINVDDAIWAIAEFEDLETLTFHTKFDNARIGEFAALKNLTTLSIACQPATDATAEFLGKLPMLERVSLGKCDFTDTGMQHIAKLKRLKQINLSYGKHTNAGLAELTACTELTSLVLGGAQIDDESLKHIGRLTNLVHLDLTGAAVTDAGLAPLENLNKLRSLNVAATQITQRRVDQLREKLGTLESASGLPDYIDPPTVWRLWQKNAHVGWEGRQMTFIVVFHVVNGQNDKKVDAADLAALKGADGLTSLGLLDCPIRDEDLTQVLRFNKLRILCLSGTKLTDDGVKRLAELPDLRELDLANTQITDEAVEHLAALTQLKKLDVKGTHISDAGFEQLQKRLPQTQVVVSADTK